MSFKPIRMDSKTSCVSAFDPAIDHAVSDWKTYGKELFKAPGKWREFIKIRDGEQPTVFVIGVIPPDELIRIEDECGIDIKEVLTTGRAAYNSELCWRCFLHGLRDIEDWGAEVPKKTINGLEYVNPAWIRRTFICGLKQVAVDIGAYIWAFNQITEQEVKN